ncbi:MAG: phosphoenolpyruvate carboxykinase (ATP) [Deltaproteobacteria bacterium]|nr:phosphoenolpyruvate carboxykinase (ATP) [Deltaproteobacteria bacterium]
MNHPREPRYGLEHHGIKNPGTIYWNLSTPELYEQVIRRREAEMAHLGPLVVRTGHHTGRSPNDKRIVKEASSQDKVWWSPVNMPMAAEKFEGLYHKLLAYLQGKEMYVQDCHVGADLKYRVPIRIITESAWHNLFSRNMFIRIKNLEEYVTHVPKFTIINVPRFHANPERDGTNSEAFIIVNFGKKLIIIGGTSYAGEIKKSVFTVLNYLYPQKRVLSMHCSANVGEKGDVAIFFGLSGTGKTTLSADPDRYLIGDDEHGWSDHGVFNFEGGCYAKVIRLSKEAEPDIYECTRKFGTILENVAIDPITRRIDLNDASLTENTRAAYPISHIPKALRSGIGGHPLNVIMLTYDAFGVLPPIAKLTPEQAMYQFLTGYTAKVAGTEKGLGKEPQATFSTCFGAPFMALPPTVYAGLLGERIQGHKVHCWLVNTGLTGGPFGKGKRLKIAYTRAMIRQALEGKLQDAPVALDPIFNLQVPTACDGVPQEMLDTRSTWKDKKEYDRKARELAARFRENFKQYASKVSAGVKKAGPKEG